MDHPHQEVVVTTSGRHSTLDDTTEQDPKVTPG